MSRFQPSVWRVTAAILLLGACAEREQTLPREVTTAIETAFNRDDPDGIAAVFAEDARILPEGGAAIVGRDAIRDWYADQISHEISFDTDTTLQLVQGDLAVEQGTYRVRNVAKGADVEAGKYLTVWRRTGEHWKLFRMMFNTDLAPRAAVSVAEEPEAGEAQTPAAARPAGR